MDPFTKLLDLGRRCLLIYYQRTSTGETWTDVTTCHGIRINISLVIAVLAGHKALQVLWLIDLTS
jgi:hypothetical protein